MLYKYHNNKTLNTYNVVRSNKKSNIHKIIITKDFLIRRVVQKHGPNIHHL